MFLSVIDSLPTTAYIKKIEIWLIYTLMIPFKEVLLLSFIHHNSNACDETARVTPTLEEKEAESKNSKMTRLMKAAVLAKKFGIPVSFVIFSISYWVIGLTVNYNGQP